MLLSTRSCRQAFPLSGTMQRALCTIQCHPYLSLERWRQREVDTCWSCQHPPSPHLTWQAQNCPLLPAPKQNRTELPSQILSFFHTSICIVQCQILSESENSHILLQIELCVHFHQPGFFWTLWQVVWGTPLSSSQAGSCIRRGLLYLVNPEPLSNFHVKGSLMSRHYHRPLLRARADKILEWCHKKPTFLLTSKMSFFKGSTNGGKCKKNTGLL